MGIFGHAAALFPEEFCGALERVLPRLAHVIVLDRELIRKIGKEIFGIEEASASKLAAACPAGLSPERPPRISDAVAVLRHLAETGEVDWGVAPGGGAA